jgi:hypothetical protein
MGTSAETAIVDYRLLFADQGEQTSVFQFSFYASSQQTEIANTIGVLDIVN